MRRLLVCAALATGVIMGFWVGKRDVPSLGNCVEWSLGIY